MKKTTVILALAVLVPGMLCAQPLPLPPRTVLMDDPGEGIRVPDFHPYGWSRDGKFGFFTFRNYAYPVGECTDFRFLVMDLKKGGIVSETKRYSREMLPLQGVWGDVQPELFKKLSSAGVLYFPCEFLRFPTVLKNGDIVTVTNDLRFKNGRAEDGIETITVYAVTRKSSRVIYHASGQNAAGFWILGYFKSPWESGSRIAVVMAQFDYSPDGPPLALSYVITGCDLSGLSR